MNNIEARFMEIEGLLNVIGLFGLFIFALMVIEFFWDKKTGRNRSWAESGANFVIAIVNGVLDKTIIGSVFFIALYFFEQFAFMTIAWSWQSWLVAIIAADLSYYWMHRIEHQVRFFWSFHSVHHSSQEFNLTTGMRLAWVESLFEWIFLVPMILAGFDMVQTVGAFMVVVAYQSWIHTDKIRSLGWLDVVFNTPSPHRVHHGSDKKYLDKNYGGILLVWDHLFGTYQKEEEVPNYGLVQQIESSNPLVINFNESWQMAREIVGSGSFMQAMRYVWGRPGSKSHKKIISRQRHKRQK